jgi:hypothetical protein
LPFRGLVDGVLFASSEGVSGPDIRDGCTVTALAIVRKRAI